MREINDGGLKARLYEASTASNKPGVVVFDGAGGGFPADARAFLALAEAGYTTLAVAYFRDRFGEPPGLPGALSRIPLEYALKSLEWMRDRRGSGSKSRGLGWPWSRSRSQSNKVVVIGQSRGAELALLLGTRCSFLSGVAAFSPSDAVWQSQTYDGGEPTSGWTENGRELPFRKFAAMPGQWRADAEVADAYLSDVPDAIIPVERIHSPVLLVSSRADRIWPSAKMADNVAEKLRGIGRRVENLQFDDASHLLMGFGDAPVRVSFGSFTMELGGSEEGTRVARDSGWKALLRFLAQV